MGLAAKLRELRWRAVGHYTRPLSEDFFAPLAGAHALEIGGPSHVFTAAGLLPTYPLLASVDGVQWAAETAWHKLDEGGGYRPEEEPRGELRVVDDVDLLALASGSYDLVMSSHVIEHIANPLRALAAWRRITRPGGHVLIVAPHMQGTFDHRRRPTTLAHVIEDFERQTGEDDLTHLQETLELHDRSRDSEAHDDATWAALRRNNHSTRLLHHHTFTTATLLALLDHAGAQLLASETRFPHDIYVLARWPQGGTPPDNHALLTTRRGSPFSID